MDIRFFAFIASSVDGYIADADGSIQWLEQANLSIPQGEDCGYQEFIDGIDALVMGLHTFEQALRFSEWPYGALPVFVLSHSLGRLPGALPACIELIDLPVPELAALLARRGYRNVYVDGGKTIQGFLVAGCLDEITITAIPVLLGGGATLFGALASRAQLSLINSRAYPCGFVQNRYRVLPHS